MKENRRGHSFVGRAFQSMAQWTMLTWALILLGIAVVALLVAWISVQTRMASRLSTPSLPNGIVSLSEVRRLVPANSCLGDPRNDVLCDYNVLWLYRRVAEGNAATTSGGAGTNKATYVIVSEPLAQEDGAVRIGGVTVSIPPAAEGSWRRGFSFQPFSLADASSLAPLSVSPPHFGYYEAEESGAGTPLRVWAWESTWPVNAEEPANTDVSSGNEGKRGQTYLTVLECYGEEGAGECFLAVDIPEAYIPGISALLFPDEAAIKAVSSFDPALGRWARHGAVDIIRTLLLHSRGHLYLLRYVGTEEGNGVIVHGWIAMTLNDDDVADGKADSTDAFYVVALSRPDEPAVYEALVAYPAPSILSATSSAASPDAPSAEAQTAIPTLSSEEANRMLLSLALAVLVQASGIELPGFNSTAFLTAPAQTTPTPTPTIPLCPSRQ